MQTFLPEPTFQASAAALDNVRLSSQMNEGARIMTALAERSVGWRNHAVTRQWRGYEQSLMRYLASVYYEIRKRGGDNVNWVTCLDMSQHFNMRGADYVNPPFWRGGWPQERLMWSHRAALYRKNPEFYADYRVDQLTLDKYRDLVVCCPGKHADYYYPYHTEA